MKTALRTILFLIFITFFSHPTRAQWEQINALYGGSVIDLVENNLGILFAITDNRLYKSTDEGQRWDKIGPEFSGGLQSILITTDNIMFIVSYYDGIYRSTDDGNTWFNTTPDIEGPFHNLFFDSLNGRLFTPVQYTNVIISEDYGESWRLDQPDHPLNLYEVVVDSSGIFFSLLWSNGYSYLIRSNDGIVWTDSIPLPSEGENLSLDSQGRMYYYGNSLRRSHDQGLTWETIFQGPTYKIYLWKNGHIWINARFNNLLYRSIDDGITWDSVNLDLDYIRFFEASGEKFFRQNNDFDNVYAFNVTHNYGDTWSWSAEGILSSTIQNIFINDSGTIFVNHYRKYKKSSDDGETWQELTDLPFDGELSFSGKHLWLKKDTSLYRSGSDGQWTKIHNHGSENWRSFSSHKSGKSLFMNNKLYWSNNFGDSLIEVPQDFFAIFHLSADTVLGLTRRDEPYKSTKIYSHDIYRSVDGGITWTLVHEMNGHGTYFNFTQFATDSAGTVYLSNMENLLIRSVDGGATWTILNIPGIEQDFYIWTGRSGFVYCSSSSTVYRSTDYGNTWHNYHQGLPSIGNYTRSIGVCTPTGKIVAGVSNFGLYKRDVHDESTSIISHENQTFRVYPNPAESFISIEAQEFNPLKSEIIRLLSIDGRLVRLIPLNSQFTQINLSDLNPGIYLLRRGVEVVKIVVSQ